MKSNFKIVVISFAFCLIVNISQSQQLNPDVFSVSNSYTFKGNSELDINNQYEVHSLIFQVTSFYDF